MGETRTRRPATQRLFERALVRYAFAVSLVATAFVLRKALEPVTGTGAPFVLFFGAVLVTSLFAGVRPGIVATLMSAPLGAYEFVVRAHYLPSQAVVQGILFAVDGALIVYLSHLMTRARRTAERTEERLRLANEAAAIVSWDLDVAAGRLRWSEDAAALLGIGERRSSLDAWRSLVHPDDRRAFAQAYERSLDPSGNGEMRAESRVVRADGAVRWFAWTGRTHFVQTAGGRVPVRQLGAAIDVTERRRRDDERQIFVSLLENATDFIGIADASGTPIWLNGGGRRMVGMSADHPVDQTRIADYYPPEERPFVVDVIMRSLLERGRWSGETWFRNWQTGEAIAVSDEHFLIRDPIGARVLGMGTITRDISEARRIRDRLRESEERFRLIMDGAPIGMALVALDGRFVRVNRRFCEIVGYAADELERMRFQDITYPADRGTDVELGARLARGEIPRFQLEKRYVRKDGAIVNVLLRASILRTRGGAPDYFIGQVEDITERKQAERAQQILAEAGAVLASSLDYERTLAAVGELVVRELADTCIVEIVERNGLPRRLKVVSADPRRASVCRRLEQLRLDRGRAHLTRAALETRRPFLLERVGAADLEALTQSAEHAELLRALEPRSLLEVPLLSRGELVGVLAWVSSTPSRYGPADLPFAQALADRAALAIENGRLYQLAVEATQRREEMLGIVAHDLRSPLTTILMQSKMVGRSGGEPERRDQRSTEKIERAANRMRRLIDDLLDVSTIESGHLGIARSPISARELVLESVEGQRPLTVAGALELRVELDGELPEVWGDQHRLLQVFENLIGNASKFTPAGGRITVGAATRAGDVLFSVGDTGCGIAPDRLPHVFDRFWQAKIGDGRGAGLGLAIARGIVEAHGGRIWVESTPGRGTTFSFTIPQATHAARPDAATAP